jgi:hypothetical protein
LVRHRDRAVSPAASGIHGLESHIRKRKRRATQAPSRRAS